MKRSEFSKNRRVPMLGRKFGRLLVESEAERSRHNHIRWVCACECGRRAVVEGIQLRSGSPENCRWATSKEQQNNRSDNRRISWRGVTRTLSEWSELTGITPPTLGKRLDRWAIDDAMTRPLRNDRRRRHEKRI